MRYVYYSFHFERDIWRVTEVRKAEVTRGLSGQQIIDHATWEKIEKQGPTAVRDWIERQMKGAGVTVVLIGAQTYTRPWVRYEIRRSHELGKGIVGVRIHGLRDQNRMTDEAGPNPLDYVNGVATVGGFKFPQRLSLIYRTYDYVLHDGYKNLPSWVEEAARNAGR